MKRKVSILTTVLLAILAFVGVVEATSRGAAPSSAKVKVVVTAARSGNSITYSVTLVNESSTAASNVYLASGVPSGVNFNVAGSAPKGSTAGRLDGNVVAWLVNQVPAKGSVGPFTYTVSATQAGVSPVNAFVRWVSPSEGSSISNVATAEYQLAKMRAIATWDNEIMPDKKVAITLSKGYGDHDNNKIVTSGLPSVGIGEYAYLEGAYVDATLAVVTAWSWQLVNKPAVSAASIEKANTQFPRILADAAGEYVLQLTVTNDKGEKSSSSITVNAGKYAGVALCASCHDGSLAQDMVTPWSETGHATKFEVAFGSYSATSDYCARCHTLGYNEAARNGGMADQAKLAGWDPSKGSMLAWIKGSGKTINDVKADANLSSTIGIQCENCHGPNGSSHTQAKSFEPGSCSQCHGQYNQWKESGHNRVDDHMSGNASCVKCHTAQGFIEVQARGNTAVFPNAATPDKPANMLPQEQQSGITCVACHDPHAATYPFKDAAGATKSLQLRAQGEVTTVGGWTVDAEVSAVCVKCHADNRTNQNMADFIAGTRNRGTHENTQSDIFYGKGIYDYNGQIKLTNSAHGTMIKEGCVECHMAPNPTIGPGPDGVLGNKDDAKVLSVGGHSFNMKAEWDFSAVDPSKGKAEVENTGACKNCHGTIASFNITGKADYDGDGKIEGIQDEVQGLMAVLAAKLPRDDAGEVLNYPVDKSNSTEAQRMAAWNYNVVKIDNSKGVHNPTFTIQLLQKTYKQLTGTDVPGATLR